MLLSGGKELREGERAETKMEGADHEGRKSAVAILANVVEETERPRKRREPERRLKILGRESFNMSSCACVLYWNEALSQYTVCCR